MYLQFAITDPPSLFSVKKISKTKNKKKNLKTFPDNNCSKLNIPHFSHCVSVCVCVCVCVLIEIERGRERERGGVGGERENCILSQTRLPQIHLSVLQTVCVRIFRFMIGLFSLFCLVLLFFFADVPPISQDKKVSKGNFSITYLSRTVCELTFSIKQMHYKNGTLWHSDASILFTSATVLDEKHSDAFILVTFRLLKSRLLVQKSFWIKDRTKFLQKQCTVCAAFADGDMSFLERLMLSGRSLFPWSLPFLLLFLGSVQSFATDRFVYKPAICKDG